MFRAYLIVFWTIYFGFLGTNAAIGAYQQTYGRSVAAVWVMLLGVLFMRSRAYAVVKRLNNRAARRAGSAQKSQ